VLWNTAFNSPSEIKADFRSQILSSMEISMLNHLNALLSSCMGVLPTLVALSISIELSGGHLGWAYFLDPAFGDEFIAVVFPS